MGKGHRFKEKCREVGGNAGYEIHCQKLNAAENPFQPRAKEDKRKAIEQDVGETCMHEYRSGKPPKLPLRDIKIYACKGRDKPIVWEKRKNSGEIKNQINGDNGRYDRIITDELAEAFGSCKHGGPPMTAELSDTIILAGSHIQIHSGKSYACKLAVRRKLDNDKRNWNRFN